MKKKTLIVGDSIVEHVDDWLLKKGWGQKLLSDQFPAQQQMAWVTILTAA